ncbi:PorP/SprF family type IX secretion system membrane protein [Marinigracilibium pacificum]|uniref:PorP/SprF family type IX secretion system membrane protein n=1 Tax=Marinigracilibium pacificum TaxID=2729599 RepID=A0A848IWW0_9BACT|nr:PorP/SprF family type IX secretion system membrane protein [Marinigracilibium pacificum]NMM47771.1 PorP/SprF family type IX secretion system membrane protein [Marinigracilibium pacificum]
MRILLIILVLPLNLLFISGQQYQYSLYDYGYQQVNPATISLDDYATAGLIYRNQRSQPGIKLTNFLMSAKYPFIKPNRGDRWSAIGITLGQDKTGGNGMLEKITFGGSYAFNFSVGKYKVLSWGTRLNYTMMKVNMDNLLTGNQYVPGSGFDPGIYSGEELGGLKNEYVSVSSGVYYVSTNKKKERLVHAGLSILDLNKPNESFTGKRSPVPISLIAEAGLQIYSNYYFSFYPEVLYSYSAATGILNIGMVTRYKLDRYFSHLQDQTLELHSKYLSNQGALLGVQWNNGPLSAGISFDIPINNRLANRGAFELGLQYGIEVKSRYKRKKNKKRKSKRKKRASNQGEKKRLSKNKSGIDDSNVLGTEESINDLTPLENMEVFTGIDETDLSKIIDPNEGKAKAGDFENITVDEKMYFNFNFETDKSNLQDEDKSTLFELVKIMENDPSLNVVIEGHTDDVGSESYNEKLSIKRAKAVADFLIENGISETRIKYTGYGEVKPLIDNVDVKSRSINRRVEFTLTNEKVN